MQTLNRLFFSLLLIVVTTTGFSQQPYPKTLLWRISGKNLQKPSYLFGTMHLNDKRLFRFDDSVYRAIERSEGLAIEVNPDKIAAYSVNKMIDNLENGKKLKDVLEEKDYKKYSSALAKKFKKPAADITTNDVVKEKNKWITDYLEKGEMPTFVDAYLYNIARRQGKWVGGIEDISDQAGLMDDMFDKSDIEVLVGGDEKSNSEDPIEKLIKLYIAQDINGINTVINDYDSTKKDALLTKRNIKMARRIDSLAVLRTMFFAIGAAHLPGDDGVINLLRKRGFTVEPVISAKKIESKDYTFKEVPIPWVKVEDEQQYYHALMPGNPASVKIYGLLEMKFLLDISNYSGYCTMAVVGTGIFTNKDSVFGAVAENMFKKKKITEPLKIKKNGIEGREYNETTDEGSIRVQLFIRDKILYMAMIYGLKKAVLSSEDANKFFSSFTINDVQVSKEEYINFTDAEMAISFDAPVKLTANEKMNKQAVSDSWKVNTYTGIDSKSGAYLIMIEKEVHPGYYIQNDSIVLDDFKERMKQQYSDLHTEKTTLQGYNAISFTGRNIGTPNIYMHTLSVVRGNKHFTFMVICDSANLHTSQLENVFTSFRLLPYADKKWNNERSDEGSFTAWSPSAFTSYEPHTYTRANGSEFISYDTASSTTFDIKADTLNKYTWALNDTIFWNKKKAGFLSETDSVYVEKTMETGSDYVKEYFAKNVNGEIYKRLKLLLHGNILYSVYSSGDRQFLMGEDADKLYSSFTVTSKPEPFSLKTSKANLLLRDISSADSTTRANAISALYEADFGKENLRLLHESLFKKYKSTYDTSVSNSINGSIGRKLKKIDDPSTIAFVEQQYPSLTGDKQYLQNTALELLSSIHNKDSYNLFLKLLQQYPLNKEFLYTIKYNLEDSLALTTSIYLSLLHFANDSLKGPVIAALTITLIDSGFIKLSDINTSENDFINLADQLLPSLKQENSDGYEYNAYDLLQLLDRFNTPASIAMVKKYLDVTDVFLKKDALFILLDKKQAVDSSYFNAIAANPATCAQFYYDLKEKKKVNLFPKKYLTQKSFAASDVYNVAADDDSPSGVIYLSQKTATVKGSKYKFYLFKVSYGSGEDGYAYLGIAGGYDLEGKLLESKDDLSGLYWDEEFTAAEIDEQFNQYLQQLEENANEKD